MAGGREVVAGRGIGGRYRQRLVEGGEVVTGRVAGGVLNQAEDAVAEVVDVRRDVVGGRLLAGPAEEDPARLGGGCDLDVRRAVEADDVREDGGGNGWGDPAWKDNRVGGDWQQGALGVVERVVGGGWIEGRLEDYGEDEVDCVVRICRGAKGVATGVSDAGHLQQANSVVTCVGGERDEWIGGVECMLCARKSPERVRTCLSRQVAAGDGPRIDRMWDGIAVCVKGLEREDERDDGWWMGDVAKQAELVDEVAVALRGAGELEDLRGLSGCRRGDRSAVFERETND